MEDQDQPYIAVLDEAKSKRLKAKTMLMPTPDLVRSAVAAIPYGTTKTLKALAADLAKEYDADMTCPIAAMKCWRAIAKTGDAPWWRVTRDGKPDERLFGHRQKLAEEGVLL